MASVGIPGDNIVPYQIDLAADGVIVMAHGTAGEMKRAKANLEPLTPRRIMVQNAVTFSDTAGFEAMATAQRLGAVVEGYDVRPETGE